MKNMWKIWKHGARQMEIKNKDQKKAENRRLCKELLPAITILFVFIVHKCVPNTVELGYSHYPKVLIGVFVIYMALFFISIFNHRLQKAMAYKAAFVCGIILLIELYDLATLKFKLLPLPFFPSPDRMLQDLIDDRHVLLVSTLYSLRLLFTGYVIGGVLGFITGVLLGWSKRCAYWLSPLMRFAGPIPATALIPIAMIIFPTSFTASVFIMVFCVWFPITIMTASGVEGCRKSWLEGAEIMRASRMQQMIHVAIPAAMPNVYTGLFMGLSNSFVTLITAEMMGVKAGLGWYIRWANGWANYAKIYNAILIMAVLFSGMIKLLFYIRDRHLRWQKGIVKQ